MKKSKEYIPQFADIINKTVITQNESISTCIKCKCLDDSLQDGLCSVCRNELRKFNRNHPNEEMYDNWRKQRNSKKYSYFMRGLLWRPLWKYGFAGLCISNGFIFLLNIFFALIAEELNTDYMFDFFASLISFSIGIFMILRKNKRQQKSFYKHNNTVIKYDNQNKWVCPSCKNINYGKKCCVICGVLPKLTPNK